MHQICSNCFEDEDIIRFINAANEGPGCTFCQGEDAPTASIDLIVKFMHTGINEFYIHPVDEVPYEDGYQIANIMDTRDLLVDHIQLELPRDKNNDLFEALSEQIINLSTEDLWCEKDWLGCSLTDTLNDSWEYFSELIKHEFRFFFIETGKKQKLSPYHMVYPPNEFLKALKKIIDGNDLVKKLKAETTFYRARKPEGSKIFKTAIDLGPPPVKQSIQSNRMNPPGIPMLYGSDNIDLALREIYSSKGYVGKFKVTKDINIIDLVKLPKVPGVFSGAYYDEVQSLQFINGFSKEISKPIKRDNIVHIEYIPTQVVTEFIKTTKFRNKNIHGIKFKSANGGGNNLVFFAGQNDLVNGLETKSKYKLVNRQQKPWIRLVEYEYIE